MPEAPLEFSDRTTFERWLKTQPREVAVVLAVRSALRVVPALSGLRSRERGRNRRAILLSLLRGLATPWFAAKYTTNGVELGLRSAVAVSEALATNTADATTAAAAATAAIFAYSAAADAAAAFAALAAPSSWAALSADSREIVAGIRPTDLASRPLWLTTAPRGVAGDGRWVKLKRNLLSMDEDWKVWTTWWEARRDGLPADEEKELARLTLPEETWAEGEKTIEGVKAVNAEIARRFAAIDEQRRRQATFAQALEEVFGTPTERDVDIPTPPVAPVSSTLPATRFRTRGEVVDVLPFVPATGALPPEAHDYHRDAAALGTKLARRLTGSNAPDRLVASLTAANEVLGGTLAEILPDRLHRLSRKLSADAVTYSHPQAEWEVVPDGVAELLELSGLVDDLQHFFPTAISANAAAIRRLGLTPESATTLREINDRIEEVVEVSEGVVTERVVDTFVVDRILSGDETASVDVESEGERALVSANFINTLARTLNRDEPAAVAIPKDWEPPRPEPPPTPDAGGATDGSGGKEPIETKKTRPRRKRSSAEVKQPPTWADVAEETVRLVKSKAPPKVSDAIVEAVTKTIKTAHVSLPALAGTIWAIAVNNPVMMAVPGVGVSLAWIGYALWKRFDRRPPGT